MDQLIRDSASDEDGFCKGTLKSNKRCLKEPRKNGYCKFHEKQAPLMKTQPVVPSSNVVVTWGTAPPSLLNI